MNSLDGGIIYAGLETSQRRSYTNNATVFQTIAHHARPGGVYLINVTKPQSPTGPAGAHVVAVKKFSQNSFYFFDPTEGLWKCNSAEDFLHTTAALRRQFPSFCSMCEVSQARQLTQVASSSQTHSQHPLQSNQPYFQQPLHPSHAHSQHQTQQWQSHAWNRAHGNNGGHGGYGNSSWGNYPAPQSTDNSRQSPPSAGAENTWQPQHHNGPSDRDVSRSSPGVARRNDSSVQRKGLEKKGVHR